MTAKTRSWRTIRAKAQTTPVREARIKRRVEEELVKMDLRSLRELTGATQVSLAKRAKMAQGDVSRVERGRDHLVSTLRRYVEALGGELEITARLGDRRVRLRAAD